MELQFLSNHAQLAERVSFQPQLLEFNHRLVPRTIHVRLPRVLPLRPPLHQHSPHVLHLPPHPRHEQRHLHGPVRRQPSKYTSFHLDHWVYEHEDHANPYALRISDFLRHYDGVHVLLKNRDEVGSHFLPDINHARVVREDFAGDRSPAHYHHNWRFNGAYSK